MGSERAVVLWRPQINTIHCMDALQFLRQMEPGSVNCIVTSPPYFGLRDYGTASWEGGNPDCEHRVGNQVQDNKAPGADASTCKLCGAKRVDQQIGLEDTPQAFVERLVAIFREARRVLRDDGTCWINLGDSYGTGTTAARQQGKRGLGANTQKAQDAVGRVGGMAKQLFGIPWRVAFALQADGWYLRSDIIWAKKNPMPESVRDRPTKAHEYIFLLSKSEKYWYDADSIREPATGLTTGGFGQNYNRAQKLAMTGGKPSDVKGMAWNMRNRRSVWSVASAPYSEAHFATFPPALIEPCILAGCPPKVCAVCGEPYEQIVDREFIPQRDVSPERVAHRGKMADENHWKGFPRGTTNIVLKGFQASCQCGAGEVPGIVLDPFMGAGTTALVAKQHGRHYIGCDLNPEYVRMATLRVEGSGIDRLNAKEPAPIEELPLFSGVL